MNNPEAWLTRTAASIRNGSVPAPPPPRPVTIQRPACDVCDGLSLVEAGDGFVTCEACT